MDARVIAVANPKGGCGKTTTAVNLAACIAKQKRRVLLIDLDPQRSASLGVGMKILSSYPSVRDFLLNLHLVAEKVIHPTIAENLWILPADSSLVEVERKLRTREGGGLVLKERLSPLVEQYAYIFIDTPPSLGVLTLNALTSADKVIIPVQTQFYALTGLAQLLSVVEMVRERISPNLCEVKILATMFDPRTRLSHLILEELRKNFHRELFNTVIPVSTKLAEAPGSGLPVSIYDPGCRGALAYQKLAVEIISGEKEKSS